jgi:hypothetical protein
VGEFKKILKKATVNFAFESVQINFKKNSVKSGMIAKANDVISIINIPSNDALIEMDTVQDISLNFNDPNTNVLPYLNVYDDGDVINVETSLEKMVLSMDAQKVNIHFCPSELVTIFTSDTIRSDVKCFHEMKLDDVFIRNFLKIKKIGATFGKVYFGVDNNILYMETTDQKNTYANSLRVNLVPLKMENLALFFQYKDLVNVFSVIGEEYADFVLSLSWTKSQDLGMISFIKTDSSEKYYLLSKLDQ